MSTYTGVINEADLELDGSPTGTLILDAAVIISNWITSIEAVPPPTGGDFSSDFSADDFAT